MSGDDGPKAPVASMRRFSSTTAKNIIAGWGYALIHRNFLGLTLCVDRFMNSMVKRQNCEFKFATGHPTCFCPSKTVCRRAIAFDDYLTIDVLGSDKTNRSVQRKEL